MLASQEKQLEAREIKRRKRLAMKNEYEKSNKKVRFGRYDIKVTTIYLGRVQAGVRIEVRRLTWTQTVEIELLVGDDVLLLKKVFERIVLQNPSKQKVDETVDKLIITAKEKGLILEKKDD